MSLLSVAWLDQHDIKPTPNKHCVFAVEYNGSVSRYPHRTLKAAFRRLGSVCREDLNKHSIYAAFIMTPEGKCMNYFKARDQLRSVERN